jgi:hypothetical protein
VYTLVLDPAGGAALDGADAARVDLGAARRVDALPEGAVRMPRFCCICDGTWTSVSAAARAASARRSTSFMPQIGQLPGASMRTSGCMVQVHQTSPSGETWICGVCSWRCAAHHQPPAAATASTSIAIRMRFMSGSPR